jgi:hypothetical protein
MTGVALRYRDNAILNIGITKRRFMSKSFIRVLYGNSTSRGYPNHRPEITRHIQNTIENEHKVDFVTYVFGQENYDILSEMGLPAVLCRSESIDTKHSLTQKIEALTYALKDFDEVVLMDWDCMATKPLPECFWDDLGKKEDIQCPLYKCPRSVVKWRQGRYIKKMLAGGFFVYLRNREIADELFHWVKSPDFRIPNGWSDEMYYSRYIDNLMGFDGQWETPMNHNDYANLYHQRFEPSGCFHKTSCFKDEHRGACFVHPRKRI